MVAEGALLQLYGPKANLLFDWNCGLTWIKY